MKKTAYDELVKKVNVTDTSRLVKKRDYGAKVSDIEGEIPSINNLVTITALLLLGIRHPTLVI